MSDVRIRFMIFVAAVGLSLARPSTAARAEEPPPEKTGLAALGRGDTRTGVQFLRQADDAGTLSARGHYSLAAALGQLRARGDICELSAFRGEIVKQLTLATTAEPSLMKRAKADFAFAGVRDTVGYLALVGRLASRESDAQEIITRVHWWGAGLASVGSTADAKLDRGGRVTLKRMLMSPAGVVEKRTELGKWTLQGRELTLEFPKTSMTGRFLATGVLVIDGIGELRDEPAECGDAP